MDVANIDRDVAYVTMVVHVCCKPQCSIFFSNVCCKCVYLDVAYVFTHMLQVFYLNVVYVALAIHVCSKCMFQIFQLFQMYVASDLS
jgi:hypothetical protein